MMSITRKIDIPNKLEDSHTKLYTTTNYCFEFNYCDQLVNTSSVVGGNGVSIELLKHFFT